MQILILLGGYSAERDVSFASGIAVARALASRGHAITGLDPATGEWYDDPSWHTQSRNIARVPPEQMDAGRAAATMVAQLGSPRVSTFDTVFVALHGGAGEDGTVQTLLGLAGTPYTGSGPLSSAVAMHKDTSKRLFIQAGVPTAPWLFPVGEDVDPVGRLGMPLIVKPVAEGSTVGVTLVKSAAELKPALERAGHDPMVETFIPGRELSVGILGGRALPPVEIRPEHEIYDYECKYTDGKSEFLCPAPIASDWTETISDLAGRAFAALGCRGYARVDFRVAEDDTPYCLEVNTLPGMTSHSLVPLAAAAIGIDFADLCEDICRLAQETT